MSGKGEGVLSSDPTGMRPPQPCPGPDQEEHPQPWCAVGRPSSCCRAAEAAKQRSCPAGGEASGKDLAQQDDAGFPAGCSGPEPRPHTSPRGGGGGPGRGNLEPPSLRRLLLFLCEFTSLEYLSPKPGGGSGFWREEGFLAGEEGESKEVYTKKENKRC